MIRSTADAYSHAERREVRRDLRDQRRPITVRRSIWRVEPEIIAIPAWAFEQRIKDLDSGPDFVWLRDRILVKIIAEMDRNEGGHPKVDRFAARRCPLCEVLLVGELARQRRRLDESGENGIGKMLPCGPECLNRQRQRKETSGRS